ncbi:DUF6522 family protein [Pseudaminobacter soli (ex Li et al. 2025)]|nr:DUF6522 family protein [Mesorhizobium soli]
MRLGLVTSLVDRGVYCDKGRKRLTVRSGNSVYCLVSEEPIVSR